VCLEAVHRLQHEQVRGEGTFPGALMADALRKLFDECSSDGTCWNPTEDDIYTCVGDVLGKMQKMEALLKTTDEPARVLPPLSSWEEHGWDDDDVSSGIGFSPERAAELLDTHGPCVGILWTCSWYRYFDAGRDDTLVYRGCGGGDEEMELSTELYGEDEVGWHVAVCIAYRFCGDEMHVLVRDNQDAGANGPQRWINVEDLDRLFTLSVEPLH